MTYMNMLPPGLLDEVQEQTDPLANLDSYQCLVCLETRSLRADLPCCGSPPICTDCVRETIESSVRRNVGRPTCPNGACAQPMAMATVDRFADPVLFAAVQRVELEHTATRWCSNKQCSAPVRPDHRGRRFECNQCGHVTCLRCRDGYHRGPCVGALKYACSDLSVNMWHFFTIQDAKQCPHCHTYVIKNGGCPHFTHRREAGGCGGESCWICMQDYHNHNQALCVLRAIPYGSPKYFGPTPLLRVVTKTAAVGLALAAGALALAAGAVFVGSAPVWWPLRKLVQRIRARRQRCQHETIYETMDLVNGEYLPV